MFLLSVICACLLLQQTLVLSASHSLPKKFITCRKNDPELNSCLKNAVPDAIKKMGSKGLPSLGIFPLEPLHVNELLLNSGSPNAPIQLKIDFKDMKVHGVINNTFLDFKADLEGNKLHGEVLNPLVFFDSDYTADGKVLILPLKGKGTCRFTMTELKTVCDLTFKPEVKDDETYWIIQDFKVAFKPKKMQMNFEGLFGEDKALSKGVNDVMNENWESVLETILPEMEEAFGAIFKEYTSRIFSKVPIDKIFVE